MQRVKSTSCRWRMPGAGLALALSLAAGARAELTLTRNGEAVSAIVLGTDPTLSAQFAAAELQHHIEKITGATLPLVNENAEVAGTRILVGDSKHTSSLGLHSADFASQEYLIAFRPDTLVLIGQDASLEETARYRNRTVLNYSDAFTFPIHFEANGSLYAVYDFLERYCGVRWYTATDLGLCFTPTATLTISEKDVRRSPHMKYRLVSYSFPSDLCGDTVKTDPPMQALEFRAMRLFELRQRVGGEPYAANHSFDGYYERFLKDHPDWFAQGYEGKPPQMCYTHPEFIQQVTQDARDFFDGKAPHTGAQAGGDYFALVPMDNDRWCKCPRCKALWLDIPPEKAKRGAGQYNNDRASDYIFGFVNAVAREVRKTHPDKYLATLAYMSYGYPPEKEPLEPNVTIQMCLSASYPFWVSRQETDAQLLQAWAEESKERRKFLWLYHCFPSLVAFQNQARSSMPGFFADRVPARMKQYVDSGVRGIYIEPAYLNYSGIRSALFDQVELDVTLRLADDPTLDGGELIEEFFHRYYGPAAAPMRSFYRKVENIWCAPREMTESYWRVDIDDRTMAELGELMRQAHASAGSDLEKRRVALFDKGVWQYMQAARKTFAEQDVLKGTTMHKLVVPEAVGCDYAGDPSRVAWDAAVPLGAWRTMNMGGPAQRAIDARAVHDGAYLYLRLSDPVDTDTLIRDPAIWDGDDWELFLAKQRKEPYRQMGINPDGLTLSIAYGEASEVWDNQAVVVSQAASGTAWTVEMAVPLGHLLPGGVKAGDTFFMNIIRGIPGAEDMAWVPTLAGVGRHQVSRLGEVVLGQAKSAAPPAAKE